MKNLHLVRKIAVLAMTFALVLSSLGISAFAADQNKSFEVKGLKENKVTATAYKIVSMDDKGRTTVEIGSIADVDSPTETEILAISAMNLESLAKVTGNIVADGDGYKAVFGSTGAPVAAGLYLVKFTAKSDAEYIYNPVIVGVNNDGSKDTWSNLNISSDKLGSTAKSSKIPFEKVIERSSTNGRKGNEGTNPDNTSTTGDSLATNDNASAVDGHDGNRGDTAAKDNVVNYRIDTTLPAYGDNYFKTVGTQKTAANDPTFVVYDTLSKGLTLEGDVKVYLTNGTAVDSSYYAVNKNPALGETFTVSFTPAGLYALKGAAIEIRYAAKINEEHGVNFDGEKNTATFEYTRNPGEAASGKGDVVKKTFHYTFTINGKVNGNSSEENREVIKVGIDENDGTFVYEETTAESKTGWKPLQGAEFTLYAAKADGSADKANPVRENIYSDEDGILRGMNQLDAGKYVLVETKAPNGYAKNETEVPIEITAILDSLGRLEQYTVKVNNITVGNYKKTYSGNEDGLAGNGTVTYLDQTGNPRTVATYTKTVNGQTVTANDKTDHDEAADLINSKVGTLPSTGGMGTVLFTVVGIAIMAIALFMLFGRKKEQR